MCPKRVPSPSPAANAEQSSDAGSASPPLITEVLLSDRHTQAVHLTRHSSSQIARAHRTMAATAMIGLAAARSVPAFKLVKSAPSVVSVPASTRTRPKSSGGSTPTTAMTIGKIRTRQTGSTFIATSTVALELHSQRPWNPSTYSRTTLNA
jgi:hypothetical protein